MRVPFAFLLAPAAFLCLGATDCDQFQGVTVPPADHSAPLAVGSAFGNNTHLAHSITSGELYRSAHARRDDDLLAIASAIDSGGASRVRMEYTSDYECCRWTDADYPWTDCVTGRATGAEEASQPGSVGSKVSNGVYTIVPTEPSCPAGKQATEVRFSFYVRAWDFFGNQQVSGPHVIEFIADDGH